MSEDLRTDAQREEAINVRLADLLTESGASARAETIVRSGRRKKFPDVRVEWAGLRVAIEAKFDVPGAAADVEAQVEERLQDALGDVGVALLYPTELKRANDVRSALQQTYLLAEHDKALCMASAATSLIPSITAE
jgi:hypothetical protein